MALIVEDGTGLSDAESYISVADADAYITAYKGTNATWDSAATADKEVAARVATQYLDITYDWIGDKETSTQALDWPRVNAYDETGTAIDGVPSNVEDATAELMFLHVTGTTLITNTTKADYAKREKVDVIEIEYFEGASVQQSFPVVSRLLSDLAYQSGQVVRG
jgi:hypothetical protein